MLIVQLLDKILPKLWFDIGGCGLGVYDNKVVLATV